MLAVVALLSPVVFRYVDLFRDAEHGAACIAVLAWASSERVASVVLVRFVGERLLPC